MDGGYAEYMVVPEEFAYPIPQDFNDYEAAPLLCAGAIGYRSLRLANLSDGQPLGLTGFGASAHLVLKLACFQFPNSPVFVFARSEQERAFALKLGPIGQAIRLILPRSYSPLSSIRTLAWSQVVEGLRCLAPGGRLVINAIRKEGADKGALLKIDYSTHLWMEEIKSVANVARRDVSQFLASAGQYPNYLRWKSSLWLKPTAASGIKGEENRAKVLSIGA